MPTERLIVIGSQVSATLMELANRIEVAPSGGLADGLIPRSVVPS
jgi:hypothetical protein